MFFCSFNGFKIEDILVEGMSAADILEMYPEVRNDFEVALVAMTIDTSSLHLFRSQMALLGGCTHPMRCARTKNKLDSHGGDQ